MIGVVRVRTARGADARESPTRATHSSSSSSSSSSVRVVMRMVGSADGATDGPAHAAREPGTAHGHARVTVGQPADAAAAA